MKGGFTITKEVERVDKCQIMEAFMMGNGKMVFGMVKEFILGIMVIPIKGNG